MLIPCNSLQFVAGQSVAKVCVTWGGLIPAQQQQLSCPGDRGYRKLISVQWMDWSFHLASWPLSPHNPHIARLVTSHWSSGQTIKWPQLPIICLVIVITCPLPTPPYPYYTSISNQNICTKNILCKIHAENCVVVAGWCVMWRPTFDGSVTNWQKSDSELGWKSKWRKIVIFHCRSVNSIQTLYHLSMLQFNHG